VALVGAGAFGRFCLDAYRRSGDILVVAVADPNPRVLSQIEDKDIRLESDWRVLLKENNIEATHIATPPFARGELVSAVQDAGVSVFCEKPLALSLHEADIMIARARETGTALGINYVMRHHPAYSLLEALASSGAFGEARSISFQNFAQHVPPDHWFWDRAKSGGILVEHGVHFFDAYARLAGQPIDVWGRAPRREAVDVTVKHDTGAVARYYHEFAFPKEVERAVGTVFFEHGYIEIDGWIPTRLHGKLMAQMATVQDVADSLGVALRYGEEGVVELEAEFPDRDASYGAAIVSGMRDLILSHRSPAHRQVVSMENARTSLALALRAQALIEQRTSAPA
jgi:predicted dehydrogenase